MIIYENFPISNTSLTKKKKGEKIESEDAAGKEMIFTAELGKCRRKDEVYVTGIEEYAAGAASDTGGRTAGI